jgi:hypothetical protein
MAVGGASIKAVGKHSECQGTKNTHENCVSSMDCSFPSLFMLHCFHTNVRLLQSSIFISLIQYIIIYNPLVLHQYSNTHLFPWLEEPVSVPWDKVAHCRCKCCTGRCIPDKTDAEFCVLTVHDMSLLWSETCIKCMTLSVTLASKTSSIAAFSTNSSKHTDMKHCHPFKPLECFIQHTMLETIYYKAAFLAHTSVKCHYNELDQFTLEGIWMSISRNISWPCINYIKMN